MRSLTFSNDFSSEAHEPVLLKFHMEPPQFGGTKDYLNSHGPLTKMAALPMYVKTFKNLLLQNQECLVAESLHKSSGMGDQPKLLK